MARAGTGDSWTAPSRFGCWPAHGQKQAGLDLFGEAAQVGVVPRRNGIAVLARHRPVAIPTDAEAVAVGDLAPQGRRQALADQRIVGL